MFRSICQMNHAEWTTPYKTLELVGHSMSDSFDTTQSILLSDMFLTQLSAALPATTHNIIPYPSRRAFVSVCVFHSCLHWQTGRKQHQHNHNITSNILDYRRAVRSHLMQLRCAKGSAGGQVSQFCALAMVKICDYVMLEMRT